jgi:CPA1 family monovalent cation:H+ antiporter
VRLIYLIVGGLGIGLLIGVIVAAFERFIDNGPVELVLSLIIPYAAYLAGEEAKASGVLAVVACGLYLSRQSARIFSPGVRIQIWGAWEAMTFVLNGIVFLLIGLQMPYVLAGIHGGYSMVTLVEYGAIFSAMLIALRLIWVLPAVRLANFVAGLKGHKDRIGGREKFVIGWTGMRGVIALAAAVSIPEVINGKPFEVRNLIVFLTFSVILVTLVLQGLTLPSVIRALGLCGKTGMEPEERYARQIALKEALGFLEAGKRDKGEAYGHAYDDLIDRYEHRAAEVSGDEGEHAASKAQVYQELVQAARGAVEAERKTIIRLRDEGVISDDVQRKIERELDLEETKYDIKS